MSGGGGISFGKLFTNLWVSHLKRIFEPFLYFTILSGCILKDINYEGTPLKTFDNQYTVSNVFGRPEDAVGCQKLCREQTNCEWFNWSKGKWCYLYTSRKEKSHKEPGGATGPPFCVGKYDSKSKYLSQSLTNRSQQQYALLYCQAQPKPASQSSVWGQLS